MPLPPEADTQQSAPGDPPAGGGDDPPRGRSRRRHESGEGDLSPEVLPGSVIAGKYRIERSLGRGGMGVVLAARHIELDRPVAIKLLKPEASGDSDAVARFQREARAAGRLRNPHVAAVLDVGSLDSGLPFMVMEYLEGEDLAQRLRRAGPMSFPLAVDCVLQACEGLSEAHAAGIIHRDLKPANLFCCRRSDGVELIKVLDFGISKVIDGNTTAGAELALTRTAAIMGSPLYMSPEQLESARDVDHRTDIWALGAILFELVTGAPPFKADTLPQVCRKVMAQQPPPLSDSRADAPPGFEAALLRCLAKSPDERYADLDQLRRALAPFGSAAASLPPPTSDAPAPRSAPARDEQPPSLLTASTSTPVASASRWSALLGGALVGALLLGALGLRRPLRSADAPSPSTPPTSPSAAALPPASPALAASAPPLASAAPAASASAAPPASASAQAPAAPKAASAAAASRPAAPARPAEATPSPTPTPSRDAFSDRK